MEELSILPPVNQIYTPESYMFMILNFMMMKEAGIMMKPDSIDIRSYFRN